MWVRLSRLCAALGVAALMLGILPPAHQARAEPSLRLAGQDRVETAVAVARDRWANSDHVLLARADDFADALAGAPLAAQLEAPLLLTARDEAPASVMAEIKRLGAERVWILGGEAAIGRGVEAQLSAGGYQIERLAGQDRFGTAATIADEVVPGTAAEALLALGSHPEPSRAWPDALSAGAFGGLADHRPLLLTAPDALPAAAEQALTRVAPEVVRVIGGPAATSESVTARVKELGYDARRLAGADRYETSLRVAEHVLNQLPEEPRPLVVATGDNFPDALAAGALAAHLQGILLLVPGDGLARAPGTTAWLATQRARFSEVVIIGGPAAVSAVVEAELNALFAPTDPAAEPAVPDTPTDGLERVVVPIAGPSGSEVRVTGQPGAAEGVRMGSATPSPARGPGQITDAVEVSVEPEALPLIDSAEVTLTYGDDAVAAAGADEAQLGVMVWRPELGFWYPVSHTESIDTDANRVTVSVDSFSVFALFDLQQWVEGWRAGASCSVGGGATSAQVDVALVIDSSGSMQDNDPENLRLQAAKIFVDGLASGDQAAVVDFDTSAALLTPLSGDKDALKAAIDQIDAVGGTDIGAGLQAGLDAVLLGTDPQRTPVVILLTDGDGPYDTSLTARATENGVSVFTVGLGSEVNANLLTEISQQTGGQYFPVASADDLLATFDQVRGSTQQVRACPPLPPTGVTASPRPDGLTAAVRWFAPRRSDRPVQSYRVLTLEHPSGRVVQDRQLDSVSAGELPSTTIDGLSPDLNYRFVVQATSEAGESVPSRPSLPLHGYVATPAIADSPQGALELAEWLPSNSFSSEATIRLAGWAREPDGPHPVPIAVRVDGGSWMWLLQADQPRDDPPGSREFSGQLAVPINAREICVLAANNGPGAPVPLGCRTLPYGPSLAEPATGRVALPLPEWSRDIGRVQIVGFINGARSPAAGVQYYGDNRSFTTSGAAPVDRSRFVVDIDFSAGWADVTVHPTCIVGGRCYSALPLTNDLEGFSRDEETLDPNLAVLLGPTHGPAAAAAFAVADDDPLNHRNLVAFEMNGDDDLRVTWGVKQSSTDPAVLADVNRPTADGSILFEANESAGTYTPYFRGNCFPSLEVIHIIGSASEVTGRSQHAGGERMFDPYDDLRKGVNLLTGRGYC